MHTEMWEHPAVQENITTLRRRGVNVLDPESGRLAGGDIGAGRLADPQRIFDEIVQLLTPGDLYGTHVVVTAGGTREPIDAVRVIANRSSGKQGYAIAAEANARGAKVTLISTVDLVVPFGVSLIAVETAQQMQDAVMLSAQQADVVVMDARRFDEYQTMSIPSGISVPGAELVLRARALAPKATTRIIVNCAGRTRRCWALSSYLSGPTSARSG